MGASLSNSGLRLVEAARAWPVWVTALVVLGIQAAVDRAGGHDAVSGIYEWLGLRWDGVLQGRVWQLFTYGWLHGGFLHAGLNALCLVLVGSRIDTMLGTAVFFKVLLLGIVAGGLAHVGISPKNAEAPILVGLSGGCVSILLLLTTLSPQSRMWPLPVSGRSIGMGIIIAELLLALCDPLLEIPGLSRAGGWLVAKGFGAWFTVGHACHFGGACAGWMYGRWILRPRVSIASLRRDRQRREARMENGLEKAD